VCYITIVFVFLCVVITFMYIQGSVCVHCARAFYVNIHWYNIILISSLFSLLKMSDVLPACS